MSQGTGQDVAAVIFDYGGVLTSPVSDSLVAWLEADGLDGDILYQTLREWSLVEASPIHHLETGELPREEFEKWFADVLFDAGGKRPEPNGLLDRMFVGLSPDPRMFVLVEELRRGGITVSVLSNSWARTYPLETLQRTFADVVISGDVGLRKPEGTIYKLAVERLGIPPERAIFLDDTPVNVEGAIRTGLIGLAHESTDLTRSMLNQFFPDIISREEPAWLRNE